MDKKVVVGGTFETLHRGHRVFLQKAFSLDGEIYIGLTSDEMALETKGRKVLDFETREKNLRAYVEERFNIKTRIEKIEDKFGPTLEEYFDYIVVSPESRETALEINKERQKIDKKEIEIVEIDFVLAEDGKPISSSRIIMGEIDKEGNLIN